MDWNHRSVSLIFLSLFRFNWSFVLLSSKYWWSVCWFEKKNCQWSYSQKPNYNKINFPSYWRHEWWVMTSWVMSVNGPWTNCYSLFYNGFSIIFLAATKQLYEWFSPSVCPSVCPSVTPFWLCSHHHIIMKFSGVVTNDKSDVHAKGQGQRSKVKVTEVNSQLSRFRTVTPVWIQISWWNDAQSLMLLRRGALFFFKVIRQISRSHSSKNRRIWPRLGVSGL